MSLEFFNYLVNLIDLFTAVSAQEMHDVNILFASIWTGVYLYFLLDTRFFESKTDLFDNHV